jgi:hypothetical protein
MSQKNISIILPHSKQNTLQVRMGIIAYIDKITQYSKFGLRSVLLGDEDELAVVARVSYHNLITENNTPQYMNNFHNYLTSCLEYVKTSNNELVEIHNCINLAKYVIANSSKSVSLFIHSDNILTKCSVSDRQLLLEKCASIYCLSEDTKKTLLEGVFNKYCNVHVIGNGVFLPDKIGTKKKNVVIIGGEVIATETLLNILRQILPQFPEWKGTIIEETANKRYLFEVLSYAPIVVINLKDVSLARANILEAMAYGCAVACHKNLGVEAAYVMDEESEFGVSNAIFNLLSDNSLTRNLQKKSLKHVQNFNIQNVVSKLDDMRGNIIRASFG